MKIVLDTNIVVSGLLQSQGNPAKVLMLALAGADAPWFRLPSSWSFGGGRIQKSEVV